MKYLKFLQTGKPNKVIATQLGISLGTTKCHLHNLYAVMQVQNRRKPSLNPETGCSNRVIKSAMNDISKLKQSSQLDQRVLSVVKEDLYGKDMVIGFVVVNISCIIFWWHFVSWPEPPLLIATLLLVVKFFFI
ncbi:MAG: helix-turn-helix transcriptional regulator [Polaromonas sp.]|nr:helix-turn-helix transcriptional regulator [Polaromonas sp.]